MNKFQAHNEKHAEHSVHRFYISKCIYIYYGILLPNVPVRIGIQVPPTPILQISVWSWPRELETEREGKFSNS